MDSNHFDQVCRAGDGVVKMDLIPCVLNRHGSRCSRLCDCSNLGDCGASRTAVLALDLDAQLGPQALIRRVLKSA